MGKLPVDELIALARRAVETALERFAATGAAWLALDATAGNGLDCEFLARNLKNKGRLLAFDVQEAALENTRQRLRKAGLGELEAAGKIRLVLDGHENLNRYLQPEQNVHVAMYNLGFLPGAAEQITTCAASSLASLNCLAPRLAPGGVISVHCYTGQAGGAAEAAAVRHWAENLPWTHWRVACYDFCNKPANREFLFLACRLDTPGPAQPCS